MGNLHMATDGYNIYVNTIYIPMLYHTFKHSGKSWMVDPSALLTFLGSFGSSSPTTERHGQDQPTPSAPSGQTAAEAAAVLGRCYGTC